MKKEKIIFWITTGLFSLMMLFSAYMYFTAPQVKTAYEHLGFPDYFRIELGAAKALGAIALLLPFVPKGLKQFAYAGFTINLFSAAIAHASKGDPAQEIVTPLILWLVLVVSFIYYHKLHQKA
ncbi:DoxX family protein [Fulvivirgaceae bacterium BMA12]|uniref:DoxX family protein n=1 Tax=Agaribacillus aureus TaxID=3051825 RepID=A0ABT8LGQ4_9BACT|nr:DoxX family protein [Fulvivirgaceae bacterium BMA12]